MVHFQTKIPNLGKFWRVVGILYGHLVYLSAFWYILLPFGIFSPVLVCCVKKNLATLLLVLFCDGEFHLVNPFKVFSLRSLSTDSS
jgi:hypothetical protein